MTHDEIMEVRGNVSGTYAWDFVLAEGDTIKEKFENLYGHVRTFCLHSNESKKEVFVVTAKELGSLVVYVKPDELTPKYEQLDNDIMFIAEVKRSCGDNGYNTNFQLFEDKKFAEDEVLICNGNEVTVIKVFNLVF